MSSYCQNSTLTLTSGTAEKAVQRQRGEPVYISHLDGRSAGRAVDGRRVLHPARLPDLLAMQRLWHLQMRSGETLDEKRSRTASKQVMFIQEVNWLEKGL